MFRYLRGTLREKTPSQIVLDVNGVGYGVTVPLSTSSRLPSAENEIELHVHTRVREDAIELYGFGTKEERDLFEQLLNLQGIAAKMACSILSHAGVNDFRAAIMKGDLESLTRIPGIGKKTAQRILLEMKGVLVEAEKNEEGVADDAVDALVALGYQSANSAAAVKKARTSLKDDTDTEVVIKTALKFLL